MGLKTRHPASSRQVTTSPDRRAQLKKLLKDRTALDTTVSVKTIPGTTVRGVQVKVKDLVTVDQLRRVRRLVVARSRIPVTVEGRVIL